MLKFLIFPFIAIFINIKLDAQEIVDQIVAVVGDEIILKSDIESQRIQLLAQGMNIELDGTDPNCEILEEFLFQKLLLNQAKHDSIEVGSNEVDGELNRRLNVFINRYGSEKQLEEVYGKSLNEIREDFRGIIREQLLIQKMQMELIKHISITPSEVREFFNSIPKDSLPVIEPYFEYSELVVKPEIGQNEKNEVIEKLEEIRQKVIDGERFQTFAVLHSEDPGSSMRGGELGFISREDMVPEFSAAAFRLANPGDVSRVVKTDFGYHIIQLIERRGTMINVRHILMNPSVSNEQLLKAEEEITEIYNNIINDSITFNEAVQKYSEGSTKYNNGIVLNPRTGDRKIPLDFMEPRIQRTLNRLEPGEISEPLLATNERGQRVFKILRLDAKEQEQVASLERNYKEIKEFALNLAQQEHIEKWIIKALDRFYLRIDDSYANCKFHYVNWTKEADN